MSQERRGVQSPEQRAAQRNRALARSVSVALLVLVLLIALGAWALQRADRDRVVRRGFPVTSGHVTVPGLEASVEVLRDDRGIPHIEALRAEDAWAAVGFVQAQDRLRQMLWLRRLAQGRTAEIEGPAGLDADRLARTLDFHGLAVRQLQSLDRESLRVLEAFAAGVNARLARIRAGSEAAPYGVDTARENFEPWSPVDSLAIFKLIAWGMGNQLETNLVLDDLIQLLGGVLARPFKPTGLGVQGVEVPPTNPADLHLQPTDPPTRRSGADRSLTRNLGIVGGSAWVMAGRRTQSGAPILVADLQLPPTLPALVYEMHVRGGTFELMGAMVPGIPVVWAGRSLHVAWAVTPGRAVTVDLYREAIRPADGLYQNGQRWVPLQAREEIIKVAQPGGGLRDETWTVRSTRHGPIVDELLRLPGATGPFELSRKALALAWTGMREGDGLTSMLSFATARDAGEIQKALETHHEPVIALVYADDAGRGGMQLAGWLPYRPLPSGFVPVPGRTSVYDWRQPIDHLALPAHRLGTRDGKGADWVIASDNPLDDDLAGGGIEWLWRADEQARVLRNAVRALLARSEQSDEKVDLREAAAVQASVGIGPRPPIVVSIASLVADGPPLAPEAREILELLQDWDGRLDPDSRGAAAYHVLLDHLVTALFREPFGEDLLQRYLALPAARPHAVVTSIVTTADRLRMAGGWSDVDHVTRVVRNALRSTWVSLSHRLGPSRIDWTWGALHRLELRPFATSAAAGPGGRDQPGWPEPIAVGGDGTTPRVTRPRPLSGFGVTEASSYRIAVDLSAPDLVVSVLSPGQSEHPLHPHATDGLGRWSEGRPSVLLTNRLLIEESSNERLVLDPAS